MKEIEFIINSEKLEALKHVLDQCSSCGITVDFVMGYGHQPTAENQRTHRRTR